MSKSRSSRSRSGKPAKSRGDGLSPAVRTQRVARLLAAGRGELLGPNHYAEADALLKPLSEARTAGPGGVTNVLNMADRGASDPPTFATNAVRVPKLTFIHYADVTEIFVNDSNFRNLERAVADEHLLLAQRLQAVGAAEVVEVDHTNLIRYP